jgi:hypothetical protein
MKPSISKLFLLGAINIIAGSAFAIPLLGETAGAIKYGNLTLYKDHQDANKVYYFPNTTRFAVDSGNIPLFNMVTWGLNNPAATDAGGYFSFTSSLISSPDHQTQINKFAADHPGVSVAVLPIKGSTIGLKSTADGGAPLRILFEEFNFSKAAGRAEDDIGINAVLTKNGARAFSALFKNIDGGSAIKFDYCYVVQGLGPNMEATVKVDFQRVYDHFEAKGGGSFLWFSSSIHKVVESLHQSGAISITMNGGDANQWEYLTKISETIAQRLFKPELTATPSTGESSSNRAFHFNASATTKTEQKQETWTWKRQDLAEREICLPLNIKDLGPYRSKLITEVN